jgi:hypothetical protein
MEEKVRLLTYRKDYTFNGVEYAPLMYKVIMWLATIDSIATIQTLRDNLQNLGVFAATVAILTKSTVSLIKTTHRLLPEGPPLTISLASFLRPTPSSPATTLQPT